MNRKIIKKIRKYWLEISLVSIALSVAIVSAFLYFEAVRLQSEVAKRPQVIREKAEAKPAKISVDIAGAVKTPGLYEAPNGQILKNIIDKAGGLTVNADKEYFSKNFNLAEELTDKQKIYIPTVWDVANGYTPTYSHEILKTNDADHLDSKADYIDVNKATLEELDTLPGVGKVTAQKIIDNRPYGALQELIDKKVLGKSLYENVKELIGI